MTQHPTSLVPETPHILALFHRVSLPSSKPASLFTSHRQHPTSLTSIANFGGETSTDNATYSVESYKLFLNLLPPSTQISISVLLFSSQPDIYYENVCAHYQTPILPTQVSRRSHFPRIQ